MYARVAGFAGADPSRMEELIEAERNEIESGMQSPPPGLEGAKAVWILADRETGDGLQITLFETEDELRRGDAALNGLAPPEAARWRRTDVKAYEVIVQVER